MFRRGRLQQSLITLLALLIVTPQVLLRPCCCAQGLTVAAAREQAAETTTLPPCCQKRLQAAQQLAAVAHTQTEDRLPGIHDSSRCGCRITNQMARTSRVDLKGLLLRHLVVWMQHLDHHAARLAQPQVLTTTAYPAFLDGGGTESCARLCRWLV